jgi:hypothetical protein
MTQDTPPATLIDPSSEPLSPDEFDAIDTILDDLRSRYDETPQWEFCEGFMAALICCRRVIPQSEYLPVLLAIGEEGADDEGSFASPEQQAEFFSLWMRRWNEVAHALNQEVEALDDEAAYHPEVMDVRGALRWSARICPPLAKSGRWASCLWWRLGLMNGPPRATRTPLSCSTVRWTPWWR